MAWRPEVSRIRDAIVPLSPAEAEYLKSAYDDELNATGGVATKNSRTARRSEAYKKREAARIVGENLNLLTILSDPTLAPHREALA